MSDKIIKKQYKFKNIAILLSFILIGLLMIVNSTNLGQISKKNATPAANTSSVDDSGTNDSSQNVFKAENLSKNYKYINVKNSDQLGTGNLIVVNESIQSGSVNASDFDGIYGYLFNQQGEQIASTSSTLLTGKKEMLVEFNKLLCDFYNKTKLKTLMVNDISRDFGSGDSDNANSESEACSSEHNTGLAIDLKLYLQSENKYTDFDGSGKYTWIVQNAWKYGFIERYPEDKTQITKVKYTPSHYRYVGKPHAEIMYKNNLCLEEYIDFLKKYSFEKPYSFESADGDCYAIYYSAVSTEKTTNCPIPLDNDDQEYEYEISGDTSSGFIFCVKMISADDENSKISDDTGNENSSSTADSIAG